MPSNPSSALLEPCPPDVAFRFADGRTARTLGELASVLESEPHLAEHHRHHLHHWIRDVVGEPTLAEKIAHIAEATPTETFRPLVVDALENRVASERRPAKAPATSRKKAATGKGKGRGA